MTQTHRFGRRIPLPSTVQILHELRVFSAQENTRKLRLQGDGLSSIAAAEFGEHHVEATVREQKASVSEGLRSRPRAYRDSRESAVEKRQ